MSNNAELREKIDELSCRITSDMKYLIQLLDEITTDEEAGVTHISLTDDLSIMLMGEEVTGNNKVSIECTDMGWIDVSYNPLGLHLDIYNDDGLPVQEDTVIPASKLKV